MLEDFLCQQIFENGPLSQSQFMEYALQHPEFGYYRTQEAISRDFTTAPEISQVFGELLGAWAIDYFNKLNKPKSLSLIELGPGRGSLLADFLRVAQQLSKPFFEALDLTLVEINPRLKTLQNKRLPHSVKWVEDFADIQPSENPLIIIANEFFDALPTTQYRRKDNRLYERCLITEKKSLSFSDVFIEENQGPDEVWEHSEKADSLIHQICDRLLKQTGVFLCIDYGYEKGTGESLQALFEGKPSDPLSHIGKSDLTCHVNFSHLKRIALSKGLGVKGPLPQGHFLNNIGLATRIKMLKEKRPEHSAALEAAAQRLTSPQQMGTVFKALAIFSPPTQIPAGFIV